MDKLFYIKLILGAIILGLQAGIALFSFDKIEKGRYQLTKKGKIVVSFTVIAGIIGFLSLWVDNIQNEANDKAKQASEREFRNHVDSLNQLNYVRLDSSDKHTIELLAKYNLQRNSESTKIIQILGTSGPLEEPMIEPFYFIDSLNIYDGKVHMEVGVINDGTSVAHKVKCSYGLFFRLGGELPPSFDTQPFLFTKDKSIAPGGSYTFKIVKPYDNRFPDTVFAFFDISFESPNKSYRKQYLQAILPREKKVMNCEYEHDPVFYPYLKKQGLIKKN